MDLTFPESGPPITLSHALSFCRHGREIRELSTEETYGHWVVWGHYACSECERVALDASTHEPTVALIAGRRLRVSKR
ncbi:MAG: hypothetical protein AB7T31_08790 [Gemmatimonadales bacterium]